MRCPAYSARTRRLCRHWGHGISMYCFTDGYLGFAGGTVRSGVALTTSVTLPARQHPARPPHVAGDDDRLAGLAVRGRDLGVPRREGPRRPLAVDPHPLAPAADGVLLELGDVVADVVHQVHLQLLPGAAED